MIDRGALILALEPGAKYRGVHRKPLDAMPFTGRKGKTLGRRYADAIVAGEGVLEDLDEAIEMLVAANAMGIHDLEVVVFEIPQEPAAAPRALPVMPTPPAEGLVLLGYDVIEPIEPYASPLADAQGISSLNEYGLYAARAEAEAHAARVPHEEGVDEPSVAVRVWVARVGN